LLVPPFSVTVTESAWVVVMLDAPGVTATVGVARPTPTADDAVPEALA
jgi:hypothetical protein